MLALKLTSQEMKEESKAIELLASKIGDHVDDHETIKALKTVAIHMQCYEAAAALRSRERAIVEVKQSQFIRDWNESKRKM